MKRWVWPGNTVMLCTSMSYTTICNSHKPVWQHTNGDGGLELFQNAFQTLILLVNILYMAIYICRCPNNTLYYFGAHTSVMIYNCGASLSDQHTDSLISHFTTISSPEIARNVSHMVPTARAATVSVVTFAWTMLYSKVMSWISDTPMQC